MICENDDRSGRLGSRDRAGLRAEPGRERDEREECEASSHRRLRVYVARSVEMTKRTLRLRVVFDKGVRVSPRFLKAEFAKIIGAGSIGPKV
jgi:hypothetical protein